MLRPLLKQKPARSRAYLEFIRGLPCAVCNRHGVEAAHTGPHGLGQKSSDFSAIALCAEHHRTGRLAYHVLGPERFQQAHAMSISELVEGLNRRFQRAGRKRR